MGKNAVFANYSDTDFPAHSILYHCKDCGEDDFTYVVKNTKMECKNYCLLLLLIWFMPCAICARCCCCGGSYLSIFEAKHHCRKCKSEVARCDGLLN